jgi:FG-GAP-like repeat
MRTSSGCLVLGFLASSAVACGSGGNGGNTPAASAGSAATTGGAATGGASIAQGGSDTSSAGMPAAAGSLQAGGMAGTSGGTSTGGASGSAAVGGQPSPPGIYAPGSCSETNLRTAPPVGKELFKQAAIDQEFPFSEHWVGEWIAGTDASRIGGQTLADLDDDGDLDFAAAQRNTLPGGALWWEQCTADHWVGHKVGAGQKVQASGDALDVDGDGLVDLLSGDSWFKNPGKSREMEWPRFSAGTPNAEELTLGDVTGDGKAEIFYVDNPVMPQFWSPGATPEKGFVKGLELAHPIQQGMAWGDLNGDKANDYLLSKDYWFENNGKGTAFTEHAITATAGFDPQPLTYIGDVDGDGDNDFAMSTHWLGAAQTSRLSWVENLDGKGVTWTVHQLSDAHKYTHGVIIADFDNDKDLDILWAQNVGPSFIYENTDGKGTFVEHKIVDDFRGHTPRTGDVDCDGDLDLVGSPWGDRGQASSGESVGEPARDVLYLQNMTVENGGKAIFDADRKPYELGWPRPHCKK